MNDDRYRKEYWGDPIKALMKAEGYNVGCGACLHSTQDRKGWKCSEKVAEYPYQTKDTCRLWVRKGKKHDPLS